jgi:signal transduction histidine kinase
MERQLRETSDQLHALSRHLVTVREEEQSRIAREIHDELGQTLTVLKMDVSWLASRAQRCGDDIPRKLASMNELLGATLQTVQRIATEQRPALLDNLGLVAAIQWLARKYEERTGIVCTFVHSNKDGAAVDKDLETALFRIIQEALTNAARHADPRSVQICLQVKPAEILLQIEDDGSGIAPTQTNGEQSFGLLGMRERLYAWNGHLTITSAPGQGTALHIVVPRPG